MCKTGHKVLIGVEDFLGLLLLVGGAVVLFTTHSPPPEGNSNAPWIDYILGVGLLAVAVLLLCAARHLYRTSSIFLPLHVAPVVAYFAVVGLFSWLTRYAA